MTSDKKIEMSLDDIIKEDRKRGDGKRGKKRGAIRKPKSGQKKGRQNNGGGQKNQMVATKRLVHKLVQKALEKKKKTSPRAPKVIYVEKRARQRPVNQPKIIYVQQRSPQRYDQHYDRRPRVAYEEPVHRRIPQPRPSYHEPRAAYQPMPAYRVSENPLFRY